MITARLALLGAFAIAAPAAAAAPEHASQAATNEVAPHPDALEIAGLMLPVETAVEASVRVGKQAFFDMFRQNAEATEMERELPGIAAALWPALEPELRQFTREEHPGFLNTVATFYTSRFTPDELKALHTLYASPTGKKMIGAVYRNAVSNAIVEEMIQSPGAPVSQTAAREAIRQETGKLVDLLTNEDEARIQAAFRVIPMAKLERANGELAEVMVQWLNRPSPELDARLDAVMGKAMARYIAEHPPKN